MDSTTIDFNNMMVFDHPLGVLIRWLRWRFSPLSAKIFCSSGLKAEEHRKVSIGGGKLKTQECTCYHAGSDGAVRKKTLKKPPSTSTRRVQGGPQAGDGEPISGI